jgi:thiol-disulfide isomerase/thioredoxin
MNSDRSTTAPRFGRFACVLASLVLLGGPLAGCSGKRADSSPGAGRGHDGDAASATPGAPAPRLIDADAEALSRVIGERGARVTLVNVWASWCKPCVEEFPELMMVETAYRDSGLRMVLISADLERADADSFLTAHGVSIDSYYKTGPDEAFINALDPKWSGALPATMVYDAEGRRRASWEGKKDYIAFEKAVLEAMQPPSQKPTR